MAKITELPESEIKLGETFLFYNTKCDPRQVTLQGMLDEYALEFAYYLTDPKVCTGDKLLEDILEEFKEQHTNK